MLWAGYRDDVVIEQELHDALIVTPIVVDDTERNASDDLAQGCSDSIAELNVVKPATHHDVRPSEDEDRCKATARYHWTACSGHDALYVGSGKAMFHNLLNVSRNAPATIRHTSDCRYPLKFLLVFGPNAGQRGKNIQVMCALSPQFEA
jgi:hypothetical protein